MKLETVTTDERLFELFPKLMGAEHLAIDTETTGLNYTHDVIAGVCLAPDDENGFYVAFGHVRGEKQCSFSAVQYVMENLLLNPNLVKVFHHLKYDWHLLLNTFGHGPIPPYHDSMVMGFIVDNTVSKGLKEWSERLFGGQLPGLKEDLQETIKSRGLPSYAHLTPEEIGDYGAADAIFTLKLSEFLWPRLVANKQTNLYRTEMRIVEMVLEMERKGVRIDQKFLRKAGRVLAEREPIAQRELNEIAGWEINPRSNKDVPKLLYEQMGFPILMRTDAGNPSTAHDVLINLPNHKVIDLILELRALRKARTTYVEGILEKIDEDGRLHCHFNQLGAGTGRFSSSKPNLQNIPREGTFPISVRGAFVPSPGHIMVFIDYRQVEMRVFAHYSDEKTLLQMIEEGVDLHTATAAIIDNTSPENVSKERRKFAKKVNFGYVYGIGKRKLARELEISEHQAEEFLRLYDMKFPGVPRFMEETKRRFELRGYVENVFGRRRKIPWNKAYRATNTLIQGTAADIIKKAMENLIPILRTHRTFPWATIHDEIDFEVPIDELEVVEKMVEVMENFHFRVPIEVDVEWSDTRWGNKRKWNGIQDTRRALGV